MNRVQVPVEILLTCTVSHSEQVMDIHRVAEDWKYIETARWVNVRIEGLTPSLTGMRRVGSVQQKGIS
jgi:hypothetical protein